jgi:hypothetical protein
MRTLAPARLLAALALAVASATPSAARAQFAVYTDLAAFLAATSGAGTDTFDDLAAGPLAAPLARTAGSFGYSVSANTSTLYGVGPAADRWLSADVATDVVTFNGFGPAVRAVGGFFFGTDLGGAFRAGTSLTVRATGAGGATTRVLTNAATGTFLGFVGTGALTSLTVEAGQPAQAPADLAFPTVNALVVAAAPASSVVPEPATVVLVAAGAAVLVPATARRRRR